MYKLGYLLYLIFHPIPIRWSMNNSWGRVLRGSSIKVGRRNRFRKGSILVAENGEFLKVGDRNRFGRYSEVNAHGGEISIGDDCFIGPNVIIQGKGGVSIGNSVFIASGVFISSSDHDIRLPNSADYLLEEIGQFVTVGNNVWIGSNSVITKGVVIGDKAIVGAGSIVTKQVPPYSIVAGNPARVIKKYNQDLARWQRV